MSRRAGLAERLAFKRFLLASENSAALAGLIVGHMVLYEAKAGFGIEFSELRRELQSGLRNRAETAPLKGVAEREDAGHQIDCAAVAFRYHGSGEFILHLMAACFTSIRIVISMSSGSKPQITTGIFHFSANCA